jgi:hypothetical protein
MAVRLPDTFASSHHYFQSRESTVVESPRNEVLNQVLVNLGRSLLQYVGECWPWTDRRDETERNVVADCVHRQRDTVQDLADLLVDRNWPVDYGSFPTEYTDLHFVELDYLLPQLLDGERALVRDLELAIERCFEDVAAVDVLRRTLAVQSGIVRDLELLVTSSTTSAA